MVDNRAFAHNGNCVFGASIFTSVGDTASASGCNEHTFCGALVASDVDNLHNIGVLLVATTSHSHPLLQNCPLLVDAATEFGFGTGGDFLGNINISPVECAIVSTAHNLFEYIVFEELYAGVENFILFHCTYWVCKV